MMHYLIIFEEKCFCEIYVNFGRLAMPLLDTSDAYLRLRFNLFLLILRALRNQICTYLPTYLRTYFLSSIDAILHQNEEFLARPENLLTTENYRLRHFL